MLQMQAVAQWAAIQRGESDGSWEDDAHEMYIDEDEVRSNDSRSEGEIESARLEMEELQRAVPMLKEHFPLIDRLGEGAFLVALELHASNLPFRNFLIGLQSH